MSRAWPSRAINSECGGPPTYLLISCLKINELPGTLPGILYGIFRKPCSLTDFVKFLREEIGAKHILRKHVLQSKKKILKYAIPHIPIIFTDKLKQFTVAPAPFCINISMWRLARNINNYNGYTNKYST